ALREESPDDQDVIALQASAWLHIGKAHISAGRPSEALAPLEHARAFQLELKAVASNEPEATHDLAEIVATISKALVRAGKPLGTEAAEASRRLRALVEGHPKQPRYQMTLIRHLSEMGLDLTKQKRFTEAEKPLREANDLIAAVAKSPDRA